VHSATRPENFLSDKLGLIYLVAWLLEGSYIYIYEGNKTLNIIFFMHAIHFFSLHVFSIINSCTCS
jgi:hypothetical protein